ncbi:MAG: diphosphate--fructose-6-phosphate 1-phosphotransferase, partial [Gammaproteobacteria bacterium]|nr:diphosphate--fructose-6-phosphate 1-phosphotransferase [Gammaproteobacteria bacterium]
AESGRTVAVGRAPLGGVAPMMAELVRARLGHKFHWAVADYLQRAARHVASATDVEQAYAVGRHAVELALAGKDSVMATIVRTSDAPYRWELGDAPFTRVANVERKMPKSFISRDGFGITAAARRYLEPLIAGEDYPPYASGLPDYVAFAGTTEPKKLAAFAT